MEDLSPASHPFSRFVVPRIRARLDSDSTCNTWANFRVYFLVDAARPGASLSSHRAASPRPWGLGSRPRPVTSYSTSPSANPSSTGTEDNCRPQRWLQRCGSAEEGRVACFWPPWQPVVFGRIRPKLDPPRAPPWGWGRTAPQAPNSPAGAMICMVAAVPHRGFGTPRRHTRRTRLPSCP